jgi:hypothetical protein
VVRGQGDNHNYFPENQKFSAGALLAGSAPFPWALRGKQAFCGPNSGLAAVCLGAPEVELIFLLLAPAVPLGLSGPA